MAQKNKYSSSPPGGSLFSYNHNNYPAFNFSFYAGRNDYRNFTVTEAVNINGENLYRIFENEQTVNVELQLPEEAFFKISGTPQLIREVDYLRSNE